MRQATDPDKVFYSLKKKHKISALFPSGLQRHVTDCPGRGAVGLGCGPSTPLGGALVEVLAGGGLCDLVRRPVQDQQRDGPGPKGAVGPEREGRLGESQLMEEI